MIVSLPPDELPEGSPHKTSAPALPTNRLAPVVPISVSLPPPPLTFSTSVLTLSPSSAPSLARPSIETARLAVRRW